MPHTADPVERSVGPGLEAPRTIWTPTSKEIGHARKAWNSCGPYGPRRSARARELHVRREDQRHPEERRPPRDGEGGQAEREGRQRQAVRLGRKRHPRRRLRKRQTRR